MKRFFPVYYVALVLLVPTMMRAGERELSRVEVAKRGKASVAALNTPKGGISTAVCVHPSGLFLTSARVVRAETNKSDFSLVLNPGLPNQQSVVSKIVRVDNALDLALLRIDNVPGLSAAPFGSDDALSELQEVISFGFAARDSSEKGADFIPTIAVGVQSIAALPRRDKVIERIRIENSLSSSHVGGPLLDRQGRLVGIMAMPAAKFTANQAVPIGQIGDFLAQPTVTLNCPTITTKNLHEPLKFGGAAIPLIPTNVPLSAQLILSLPDQPDRTFDMRDVGGKFEVEAVPVPAAAKHAAIKATIRFPDGQVQGAVADKTVTVADRPLKFSEIRRIDRQPVEQVICHDGRIVEGAIKGLDSLDVALGGKNTTIGLGTATDIEFERPLVIDEVTVKLSVLRRGKEIVRLVEGIAIERANPSPIPPPKNSSPTEPPSPKTSGKLESRRLDRLLPSPIGDVAVGGGGRFLILHLPRIGKLAVYDASVSRIVHYFDVPENDIKFAAGRDKLFIALPQAKLQRWSLATFKNEVTAPLPVAGRSVHALVMGAASDGPLGVEMDNPNNSKTLILVDAATLNPTEHRLPRNPPVGRWRASPFGDLFTAGDVAFVREGPKWKAYQVSPPDTLLPAPDGARMLGGRGIYSVNARLLVKRDEADERAEPFVIPALQGQIYLSAANAGNGTSRVNVRSLADGRLLFPLTDIETPQLNQERPLAADQQMLLNIAYKQFVVIPASADRLCVHPFDLDQRLEGSKIDYLLVVSPSPSAVALGQEFAHDIVVKSRKGAVRFRLETGPEGMTVSGGGRMTWRVPPKFDAPSVDAVIVVSDASGQEILYRFSLAVRPPEDAQPIPPSKLRPSTFQIPPKRNFATVDLSPPKTSLPLNAPAVTSALGANGTVLIMHIPTQKRLVVFDARKETHNDIDAPSDDILYAATSEKLYVLDCADKSIRVYRLANLQWTATVAVSVPGPFHQLFAAAGAQGPIFLATKSQLVALDANTLRPTETPFAMSRPASQQWFQNEQLALFGKDAVVRISGDGRLIASHAVRLRASSSVYSFQDGAFRLIDAVSTERQPFNVVWTPGNLGKYFYSQSGLLTSAGKLIDDLTRSPKGPSDKKKIMIPAAEGEAFFLTLEAEESRFEQTATIFLDAVADQTHLAKLGTIALPKDLSFGRPDPFGTDRRCLLIPSAKLLLVVNPSNDRLDLLRVDPYGDLGKAGREFLSILSKPPREAARGSTFHYRPNIHSAGEIIVRLCSGPEGMSFSDQGIVTWRVPPDFERPYVDVLLGVTNDLENEVFQAFRLSIQSGK